MVMVLFLARIKSPGGKGPRFQIHCCTLSIVNSTWNRIDAQHVFVDS